MLTEGSRERSEDDNASASGRRDGSPSGVLTRPTPSNIDVSLAEGDRSGFPEADTGAVLPSTERPPADVPTIVLICPQLFRECGVRDHLVAMLKAEPERLGSAVRLYSTIGKRTSKSANNSPAAFTD